MKKRERNGGNSILNKQVPPEGIIPPDLLKKLYMKDNSCITECQEWVDKYGLTILFARGIAKGWENVFMDNQGVIWIYDESQTNYPTVKELRKEASKYGLEVLQEVICLGKNKKKILNFLENLKNNGNINVSIDDTNKPIKNGDKNDN
jgi:hypothetical protein